MIKNLPEINFVDTSPDKIESAMITTYEAIANRTLAQGDPVKLLLQSIAAIIIQQRILIDYSAKQNMLAYAEDDYLDHIGVLVGTPRLPATTAKTTLRFNISLAQTQIVGIPAGTRVSTVSNVVFKTVENAVIMPGNLTVNVDAECTISGIIGSGFTIGQINKLVDPFQWFQSVANITTSEGGADLEDNENYRERIRQAPERFSTAGPDGAYLYHTKKASQLIVDATVYSPTPGVVEIRPLLVGGELPKQEILDIVLATCNDKKVRPLTDKVVVLAPEIVNYDINIAYYIDQENAVIAKSIQDAVNQAINDFVIWQKSKLQRDINQSELIARIITAGAKRVQVISPNFTVIKSYQVGVADKINIVFGGLENG